MSINLEKRKINNADDYEGYACDALDAFLQDLHNDPRYTFKPEPDSDEFCLAEEMGCSYLYTDKGARLAQNALNRYIRIGEQLFPEDDIDISSTYFREL